MNEIRGRVEEVKKSDNRFAIKVNDQWYSKFGNKGCPNEGDEIDLKFSVTVKDGKTYFNIDDLKVRHPSEQKSTDSVISGLHVSAEYLSLKLAAELFRHQPQINMPSVMDAARRFYDFMTDKIVDNTDQVPPDDPFINQRS